MEKSKHITEAQWDTASTPRHLERREALTDQQAPRTPPAIPGPCTAHSRDAQSSPHQSRKELRTSPLSNFPPSSADRP